MQACWLNAVLLGVVRVSLGNVSHDARFQPHTQPRGSVQSDTVPIPIGPTAYLSGSLIQILVAAFVFCFKGCTVGCCDSGYSKHDKRATFKDRLAATCPAAKTHALGVLPRYIRRLLSARYE